MKLSVCVSSVSGLDNLCSSVLVNDDINLEMPLISYLLCSEYFFMSIFKLLSLYALNISVRQQVFDFIEELLKSTPEQLHLRHLIIQLHVDL